MAGFDSFGFDSMYVGGDNRARNSNVGGAPRSATTNVGFESGSTFSTGNSRTPGSGSSTTAGGTADSVVGSGARSGKDMVGECCVPATISMLEKSFKTNSLGRGTSGDRLMLHGSHVGAVVITGWICDKKIMASKICFRLADGTGSMNVRYDFEDDLSGGGGGKAKMQGLEEGKLIRVIGSVRRSEETESTSSAGNICSMDACHFKIIESEFEEYAYFANTETVYAAIKMCQKENDENEKGFAVKSNVTTDGSAKEDRMKTSASGNLEAGWEENWQQIKVSGFSHISDSTQCDVLRILSAHPLAEEDGVSREIICKAMKKLHDYNEIDDALAQLSEEGEIVENSNKYMLLQR